jgi:hypothetical protein
VSHRHCRNECLSECDGRATQAAVFVSQCGYVCSLAVSVHGAVFVQQDYMCCLVPSRLQCCTLVCVAVGLCKLARAIGLLHVWSGWQPHP